MSWIGQSDAIHSATTPAENDAIWKRVATGVPAGASRGPSFDSPSAYPTPKIATSSHTSGWACQAGNGTSATNGTRLGLQHGAREHHEHNAVHDGRKDDPHDEEPTEQRVVRLHVHVPAGDEHELHDGHRAQGDDDPVRVTG